MSRFFRSTRALVPLLYLLGALAFVGCGGGSSATSVVGPGLSALKTDFTSDSVGEYQGVQAAINYPFQALELSSTHASARARAASRPIANSTPTFVPLLGLYETVSVTTSTITINYFVDYAETQPAGNVTINVSGLESLPIAYPVTVPVNVNITAGNLPATGTLDIAFLDSKGAATLKGSLYLPRNATTVTLNLALDDEQDVSGSITIALPGTTIQITNISGNLSQTLSCDVTITPPGWSGTGTINFQTGAVTLSLETPLGLVSASTNGSGALILKFPDGSSSTINNPVSTPVLGGSTTGG